MALHCRCALLGSSVNRSSRRVVYSKAIIVKPRVSVRYAVSPHLPKKIQAIEASMAARELWKTQSTEERTEPGITAKFKNMPVNERMLRYIQEEGFGRYKAPRGVKKETQIENKNKHRMIRTETDKAFARSEFLKVFEAGHKSAFPKETLPEVAVIGRSNVGKSSFVNALTEKFITGVSRKPGHTQTISWYSLRKQMYLVDLPGYGFALAPQERRESWGTMVINYITMRKTLKRVIVLIDSRQSFKQLDFTLCDYLESIKMRFNIVLTKTDMVDQEDLAKQQQLTTKIAQKYRCHVGEVHMMSAKTFAGVSKIRNLLSTFTFQKNRAEKPTQQQKKKPPKPNLGLRDLLKTEKQLKNNERSKEYKDRVAAAEKAKKKSEKPTLKKIAL